MIFAVHSCFFLRHTEAFFSCKSVVSSLPYSYSPSSSNSHIFLSKPPA